MTEETVHDGSVPRLEFTIQHRFLPTSHYSNHLVVQADEECVYLHFFQMRPPVIIAGGEVPSTVSAEPVICIAVDITKMVNFVETMQTQIKRMKERANENDQL